MNKALGRTSIKDGQGSLEFTANDIKDRIINIKFIRKSGRSFTLRSDYEPVFHLDDTINFRTCVHKPDIKVTYKQVAETVAIEVDIEIVNFYMGDGDTEDPESLNTAEGDPVQWCIVQMGYRRQFPDWTLPERKANLAQFYDLNNNALTSEAEVRRGRQILVQILTGYPKTYPPDKVTYFKGIIGTMENGLRWNHTEADLVKGYGDANFPQSFSETEEVLFQFVTRRFIRASVLHIAETVQDFTNKEALTDILEKKFEQNIRIYNYHDYTNTSSDSTERLRESVTAAKESISEGQWAYLQLMENGIMSIEDANKFGVICAVSKTLRSMAANSLYGYGLSAEQAAALRPIPPTPFDEMQDTLGGQLVSIQQHYPFLRWYGLTDGSFYFYHEKDTDEDLWSDPFIKEMQKEDAIFLPAIYDMTPSGTRTIRCPFISFIGPMTTVLFQSRFTIGTLVSYFYPPKTNAFLVILATIAFSTVGEDNLMELMCVDLPPKEFVVDEESGEVSIDDPKENNETPEVAILQQERNMQWIEQQLSVVLHKTGAMDTDSRWENIVKNDVLADIKPERWPEGQEFTERLALTALKEWNHKNWDEWMNRGNSIENVGLIAEGQENPRAAGIGGRTGIKVPWLKEGIDTVIVRHPFQPEYPDSERVVV